VASPAVTILQWPDTQYPGRSDVSFQGSVTPTAAEAAFILDLYIGGAYAATTGSSYTVPVNKRLRIQAVHTKAKHTAALDTEVNIRLTTSLTGNLIRRWRARVAASGSDTTSYPIPEGIEFPAATVLQFSEKGSVAGGTLDVNIEGFLYDVQS
jgi:hypothetical protein